MIRLKSDQFATAAPLFAGVAAWNVYVTAVLQQKSPGRVYVDDLANPQSGFLVCIDRAYLVGNPQNELRFNRRAAKRANGTPLCWLDDRVNPDDSDPELVLTWNRPTNGNPPWPIF